MTLEDFFTLTEMKDGLTAPGRVQELVTVMQKEKDYVVKNVSDATRQWSAVAGTIAATENKDCLDLFIQLDGLWFINRWLKDAQNFCNDTSDSFVEESITALLRALEKLHIDNEKSISSGIWITVRNLLGHNSSRVQERARALFNCWKQGGDSDADHQDVEKVRAFRDDDGTTVGGKLAGDKVWSECCAMESKEIANEGNLTELARDEMFPSRSSDGFQPERVENVPIETSNNEVSSIVTLDRADTKDRSADALDSSAILNPVQENLPTKEESPVCPADGTTSVETCGYPLLKQGIVERKSDASKLSEFTDDGKQIDKMINSSSEQVAAMEISSSSTTLEPRAVSLSAVAANAEETLTKRILQKDIDTKEGAFCLESSSPGDVKTLASEEKTGMDNTGVLNHCRSTLALTSTGQGGECYSNAMNDTSGNECTSGRPEDRETSFARMEDIGAVEVKEHASDGGEDLTNTSDFSNPVMDVRSSIVIDERSDNELEYGIVDALEVARQVAREVGDYREPFCSSSSEKISEGLIGQPRSPDSINGKHNQSSEDPPKEVPAGQNLSPEASLKGEGHLISSDNPDTEPKNCMQDMEAAQEPKVNPEKGMCDFDLNQEVCSEDMDRPVNPISTPVSVVSASRATAALGLPAAPLQFEGTLGWKGSAATSAFRPASPRRIPDGDKTLSVGGSSSSSKPRQDCLDFDLNVAEGGDDKNTDLLPGKQIPISSGLPSGESSVEASPRRSEKPMLDLNCIGDDGDAPPSDWGTKGRLSHHRNGHRSPSPASSSSSMHPCMRNIDLNDRPSIHDLADQQLYLGKSSSQYVNAYEELKSVDPVISIMGTRVEVNRKDIVPTPSFPNGKAPEPATDGNFARTGGVLGVGPTGSYTHSPVFGYNGLSTGPAMSFSSAMYGPGSSVPYMMDSRGAPVVPQIVGSAPTVLPAYSQPPFFMSMTGTPPGLNGAGPSRPNLDLNSGFVIEGGNRDLGVSRQFFVPGQGRLTEDHMRTNLQPSSSSGVGAKRKEPDSGWENYQFNYKHHQPPHQPPWK